MTEKSKPNSSRRAASILGRVAVAKSRVFIGMDHAGPRANPGIDVPLALTALALKPTEFSRMDASHLSAIFGPATAASASRNGGSGSIQWPSPSITGWESRSRMGLRAAELREAWLFAFI